MSEIESGRRGYFKTEFFNTIHPIADMDVPAHHAAMTTLSPGKRWLLAALGLAFAAIIVSHELIASPMRIKSAVSDGAGGFACSDLLVETPGGSWNGRSHTMHAALAMPRSCVADLRQRIESSSEFHVEQCNLVEQCWVRVVGDVTYTFTFYPEYVGFRFEQH